MGTNYDGEYVTVSSEIRNTGRETGENDKCGRLSRELTGEN